MAVISVVPSSTAVARPLVASIVATDTSDEDQLNDFPGTSTPEASFVTAVNCWVVPRARSVTCVGETSMLETTCSPIVIASAFVAV